MCYSSKMLLAIIRGHLPYAVMDGIHNARMLFCLCTNVTLISSYYTEYIKAATMRYLKDIGSSDDKICHALLHWTLSPIFLNLKTLSTQSRCLTKLFEISIPAVHSCMHVIWPYRFSFEPEALSL